MTSECADELDSPFDKGKHFTRKGSCMYEYNKLDITLQEQLVYALHSPRVFTMVRRIDWSRKTFGPDPHSTGAGYMKSFWRYTASLTDFNWAQRDTLMCS